MVSVFFGDAIEATIVFVIRTTRPFYRSRPSRPLLVTTLGVVAFAIAIPFTPLGSLFQFIIPPNSFLLVLVAFVGVYLGIAEILKGVSTNGWMRNEPMCLHDHLSL